MSQQYIISQGHCQKLGATIEDGGVNFAVYCPAASVIELLLFKDVDDPDPTVISLSSPLYRSVYYWHVFVRGIKAGQIYAWRVREAMRNYKSLTRHVEIGKVLIDPYGKRVLFPKDYKRHQGNDEAADAQLLSADLSCVAPIVV